MNRTKDGSHSPTPWELIEANEHHGAYVVNAYGADVCDLYAMSNPIAASVRNGGNSFPVHFADADANAALIVKAVNSHEAMQRRIVVLEQVIAEDLSSLDCSDELNKMIVVDILRARAEQKAAGA